jgi:hypothetical protein
MNANLKAVYKVMLNTTRYAALYTTVDLLGQFRLDYEELCFPYLRNSIVLKPADLVIFCVIDPTCPFICGVSGKFTTEALQKIEEDYLDDIPEDIEGIETITYECFWDPGDYNPGGYEGYWILEEVSRKST